MLFTAQHTVRNGPNTHGLANLVEAGKCRGRTNVAGAGQMVADVEASKCGG
jgi:hypothetical protein